MSLTSLLKNDANVVKLFSTLPQLQPLFKTFYPEKQKRDTLVAPRYANAAPDTVGTAYDFWCRAFIQRLNEKEVEIEIPRQVLAGIVIANEHQFITEEETELLFKNVEIIWKMRSKFINKMPVSEKNLLIGCLILANCEQMYRSKKIPNNPEGSLLTIRNADYYDLKQLTKVNERVPRLFQSQKEIYMNPTFGDYSKIVGGADADYIMGNMLVDIKTSHYGNINQEYINQLLGYYFLSKFDETFPCDIQQIGIFYPRYNKLAFCQISDIEQMIDLKQFASYFKSIIEGDLNIQQVSFQEIKENIYQKI